MLMVNGLTASDIASRGFPVLDLYLAQLAEEQQKKIGAVERVEEQCLPLTVPLGVGQCWILLRKPCTIGVSVAAINGTGYALPLAFTRNPSGR